jgi:hypothetical protein
MLACLNSWRYPLVWSAMAVLSYAAYQTEAYQENLWLVGLEYLVVYAAVVVEIVVRYSLFVVRDRKTGI